MGKPYTINGNSVSLEKRGADSYIKISYPQRYGQYSEIETADAIYQFNLNGEIRFARGKGQDWPDPQEWLKRTVGNDWVYYSTGGYTGVYEAIGEYYLPNLQYPTNALIGGKPFANPEICRITENWYENLAEVRGQLADASAEVQEYLIKVMRNSPAALEEKSQRLFEIGTGRVNVIPPDARHCDYDVIPLTVSTGCLYKCRFCKVKNSKAFSEMSRVEIDLQIEQLLEIYGDDLPNYNSVFFGEHDALCCSSELLLYAVHSSYERLKLGASNIKGANFFLFGSADSLLEADTKLFKELSALPVNVYINIGLESADQKTLELFGKPISPAKVQKAFDRMLEINDRFFNIEVTANFLMDESLPEGHYPEILQLIRDSIPRKKPKGTIYFSPLKFNNPSRELVFDFNRLKLQSRLPTHLYIIQRL